MTKSTKLTTKLIVCALAAVFSGAAGASEATYCIEVGGGFGAGGTTFVGLGFTVPAAGNCTPWAGFTKTAGTVILTTTGTGCLSSDGKVLTLSAISADPAWFGPNQLGSDYIKLCPAGTKSCPLSSGEDVGYFSGSAKPETCTTSLLNLPSSHE